MEILAGIMMMRTSLPLPRWWWRWGRGTSGIPLATRVLYESVAGETWCSLTLLVVWFCAMKSASDHRCRTVVGWRAVHMTRRSVYSTPACVPMRSRRGAGSRMHVRCVTVCPLYLLFPLQHVGRRVSREP